MWWESISILISSKTRSSRPEVLCKKGVLRSFAKFTGKHLCQSLLFNKVADLRPVTLLEKRLWHRCFPVNFVWFLRTPLFTEHLWWLLLKDLSGNTLSWNISLILIPCNSHKKLSFKIHWLTKNLSRLKILQYISY